MNKIDLAKGKKGGGHAAGQHGKGRLFQRGRVWWIQYYVHGVQVRESSHSRTKCVAEKLLMKRLVAADEGTLAAPTRPIMYEEMRERLVTAWLLERPDLTRKETDQSLARLDEFFKGLTANLITEEQIDAFKLARKATGASNATVNRALAALRQMIRLSAKRWKNPPEVKLLPEPPARKGFLTHEQYVRLWAALPAYLQPITAFAHSLGMRLGELEQLTWENIDRRANVIRLEADQTKSGEGREIPFGILPDLAALMAQLWEASTSDHVFTRSEGKPLGCFRKAWIRACVKASLGRTCWKCRKCHRLIEVEKQLWPPERPPKDGEAPLCDCGTKCHWHYEGLIFHDLRRTAVRNLRRAGVPESVAMAVSGHKTREVFERYNIKDITDVLHAMNALHQFQQQEAFQRAEESKAERSASRPN
jgi:integrase